MPSPLALFLVASALALLPLGALAKPWTRHTLDASSQEEGKLGADGVRLADANGDGYLDVVTGWENGDAIRVCLNPGPAKAREPWPGVTVGRVKGAEDAVFADLDGDGNLDVVTCTEGKTKTVFFHWAPAGDRYLESGAWKTEAVPVTEEAQAWMFALPMDIDGKHGIDLVVGSKSAGATVGWLQSPENPRDVAAWKYHKLHDAAWIMSLRNLDMDQDGDDDILYSDRKGDDSGVFWLENPGTKNLDPSKQWPRHLVGAAGLEVMFLDTNDAGNPAGFGYIGVAVKEDDMRIFKPSADASGGWREISLSVPGSKSQPGKIGTGKAMRFADLNRDGRDDYVITCENAKGDAIGVFWIEQLLQGPSAGRRFRDISGPEGVKFDRIELLDLDGDGDLDVITCEERANLGVIWYENPNPLY